MKIQYLLIINPQNVIKQCFHMQIITPFSKDQRKFNEVSGSFANQAMASYLTL